jgi:hypothetical protein
MRDAPWGVGLVGASRCSAVRRVLRALPNADRHDMCMANDDSAVNAPHRCTPQSPRLEAPIRVLFGHTFRMSFV